MITKFKLFEEVDKRYPKEDPNGIFTIGDRVIFNTTRFKGREGTVIAFYIEGVQEVLVKLDKKERNEGNYLCKGDNLEDPDNMSFYARYNQIDLIEPTGPTKTRWYKKGKFLEEGIRWYNKGKLDKPEVVDKEDCKHEWIKQQRVVLNKETFTGYMKYWKECRLCGAKEDIVKPISKENKNSLWYKNYTPDPWND